MAFDERLHFQEHYFPGGEPAGETAFPTDANSRISSGRRQDRLPHKVIMLDLEFPEI
jgi:hypothetical protein